MSTIITNLFKNINLKMLIKKVLKNDKSQNGLCLNVMKMFFSKMPYFREMGAKLNITIPKLNDQLVIQDDRRCLVYGIRLVSADQPVTKNFSQNSKIKQIYFDEQSLIGYAIDKNSRETIDFNTARKIAQNLQLDICLMHQNILQHPTQVPLSQNELIQQSQQPSTILSLTKFRQYIYRQYYTKQLKNKSKKKYLQNQLHNQLVAKIQNTKPKNSSDKNKIKSVRIGQDVHINDLKNKQSQVNRWLQQGQTIIKVIAHNDSAKSRKALVKFISMFDKQVEIIEQKITPDPKKRPIVRLYAILEFDNQIEVDFDFVNRRWRRRQAEINLAKGGHNNKSSVFDVDFTQQGAQIQKAYLAAFDEAGIPYPKQYSYLTKMDKKFEKQGVMSLVKQTVEETRMKMENDEFEEQQLSQQELKVRDRENRKIMEMRTVEDIILEMQEMRSREYEMEQYEASRYKQLQKQLTQMLKSARKYAQKIQS